MKVFQHERHLRTTGGLHVRDITDEVNEAVRASGISNGIACVYSPHTTCFIDTKLEFAAGLRRLGEYLGNWAAFEAWLRDRQPEPAGSR